MLILMSLYFCLDSLLIFKTLLSSCVGLTWICFFKLFFADARPYWEDVKVESYTLCPLEFASP